MTSSNMGHNLVLAGWDILLPMLIFVVVFAVVILSIWNSNFVHIWYWQDENLMLMFILLLMLLLLFLSMWNANDILEYRSHPGIGRMWPKTEGWKQGHASLLFLSKIRQCVTITLVCGGVRFAKYEIKITWTQLLYAHKAGSKQER